MRFEESKQALELRQARQVQMAERHASRDRCPRLADEGERRLSPVRKARNFFRHRTTGVRATVHPIDVSIMA
jgi:hypothetical protein